MGLKNNTKKANDVNALTRLSQRLEAECEEKEQQCAEQERTLAQCQEQKQEQMQLKSQRHALLMRQTEAIRRMGAEIAENRTESATQFVFVKGMSFDNEEDEKKFLQSQVEAAQQSSSAFVDDMMRYMDVLSSLNTQLMGALSAAKGAKQ